jgi:hypothetical protein
MSFNPNPSFITINAPAGASGIVNIDYNSYVAAAAYYNSTIGPSTVVIPQTTVQTGALVYPANYGSYYQITSATVYDNGTNASLSSLSVAGNPIAVPTFSASSLAIVGPNITGSGEPGSGNTGA